MDNFYVTLPSNDGSKKYFPNNSNNSSKTRLETRLDLEGEWEVGLSCVSLPHESKLSPYLKNLNDDSFLIRVVRLVYNTTTKALDTLTTVVYYANIKHKPLESAYDVLKALFQTEYDKAIVSSPNNFSWVHLPGKESLQFDVTYDDANETVTFCSDSIDFCKAPDDDVAKHCLLLIKEDLCRLLGWIENATYQSVSTVKNGPNLITKLRGTKFTEDRTDSKLYFRRWMLTKFTLTTVTLSVDSVIFYMHELNWVFINLKRGSYITHQSPRTLSIYSSLGAPVRMGDQSTDLLRQVEYKPALSGHYYHEPQYIHYIKLRNNHIDEVEMQITETYSNQLVPFSQDGATIVTLHFKRIK